MWRASRAVFSWVNAVRFSSAIPLPILGRQESNYRQYGEDGQNEVDRQAEASHALKGPPNGAARGHRACWLAMLGRRVARSYRSIIGSAIGRVARASTKSTYVDAVAGRGGKQRDGIDAAGAHVGDQACRAGRLMKYGVCRGAQPLCPEFESLP